MSVLTYSRALKYTFKPDERPRLQEFINMFFPTVHTFDTMEIPVDRYISKNTLARYRERNGVSNISNYVPGKGDVWNPPAIDESTPIDADLGMAVVVGLEANATATQRHAKIISAIKQDHDDMFTRAEAKQVMDILSTGKFQPYGKSGVAIGKPFDFGRDPNNTKVGAYANNPMKQLTDAYDIYSAKHGPKSQLVYLLGANVLGRLQKDPKFMELLKLQGLYAGQNTVHGGNTILPRIVETMIPERAARATFLCFDEGYEDDNGNWVQFLDPNTVILTSLNAQRVRFYGGIFITDLSSQRMQVFEGEQISDLLVTKNPDEIAIRTQSRPLFIPANPDHTATVRSNG
jgi:hypothetical protein